MKWVSKGKKKKYSIKRFFNSFKYAFLGIFEALKTEQNLLIDFIIAIIMIVGGILLQLSTIEFCIIILVIVMVISLELVNTAIEYTVDMAMPEIHPLAKIAKDVGAGAVLLSSIGAIIIGIIIYVPKIMALFK